VVAVDGDGGGAFFVDVAGFEVWQRFERIILVYSVRSVDELAYRDLLDEIVTRDYVAPYADKFTFVPVVTREGGGWMSGCADYGFIEYG